MTEVGAGLRTYSVAGRDVIDGYDLDTVCPAAKGQILAPWPNRIEDGRYSFDGTEHQLALNEPDRHNAIHGLVRWRPWTVRTHEAERAVMEQHLLPQPGYPFTLQIVVEYSLAATGLTVTTSATNLGSGDCPYALGTHPYLTLGRCIDDLHLTVPAQKVILADERGLPHLSVDVEGSKFDLRTGTAIGSTVIDHCFSDLDRDSDGCTTVVLADPEAGTSLSLWADQAFSYLMVFTGDPIPEVARRSLGIEPMTCPPNAFRSSEKIIRLAPGATHTARWGINPMTTEG